MKLLNSLFCIVIAMCLFNACASYSFFSPPGDRVGSCKGYLKPEGHSKMHFTFDIYKESGGDFNAYLSLPGKGVRYAKVTDVDFENDIVRIELSSPHRIFEGELIRDGLTIEGKVEPWIGKFKIEIEN